MNQGQPSPCGERRAVSVYLMCNVEWSCTPGSFLSPEKIDVYRVNGKIVIATRARRSADGLRGVAAMRIANGAPILLSRLPNPLALPRLTARAHKQGRRGKASAPGCIKHMFGGAGSPGAFMDRFHSARGAASGVPVVMKQITGGYCGESRQVEKIRFSIGLVLVLVGTEVCPLNCQSIQGINVPIGAETSRRITE